MEWIFIVGGSLLSCLMAFLFGKRSGKKELIEVDSLSNLIVELDQIKKDKDVVRESIINKHSDYVSIIKNDWDNALSDQLKRKDESALKKELEDKFGIKMRDQR